MRHTGPLDHSVTIHRLWPGDRKDIMGHFLRLDPTTRRLRYGAAISDEALLERARTASVSPARLYGAFVDGTLRGVAELASLPDSAPPTAEAALSVERDWQDMGIGDRLLGRAIAAAQNRGITRIHLLTSRDNARILHLARKHDARIAFDLDMVDATLDAPEPTTGSLATEYASEILSWYRALCHPPT